MIKQKRKYNKRTVKLTLNDRIKIEIRDNFNGTVEKQNFKDWFVYNTDIANSYSSKQLIELANEVGIKII